LRQLASASVLSWALQVPDKLQCSSPGLSFLSGPEGGCMAGRDVGDGVEYSGCYFHVPNYQLMIGYVIDQAAYHPFGLLLYCY